MIGMMGGIPPRAEGYQLRTRNRGVPTTRRRSPFELLPSNLTRIAATLLCARKLMELRDRPSPAKFILDRIDNK